MSAGIRPWVRFLRIGNQALFPTPGYQPGCRACGAKTGCFTPLGLLMGSILREQQVSLFLACLIDPYGTCRYLRGLNMGIRGYCNTDLTVSFSKILIRWVPSLWSLITVLPLEEDACVGLACACIRCAEPQQTRYARRSWPEQVAQTVGGSGTPQWVRSARAGQVNAPANARDGC